MAQSIATALAAATARQLTADEEAAIAPIELLRRELEASSATIAFVDHGAGAHGGTSRITDAGGARTVAELCRTSSKRPEWDLLLFHLVRQLRPAACLELGTCLGLSAAYQSAALRLNGNGILVTIEGAEPVAAFAREHFVRLGLHNASVVVGRFQDRLGEVLQAATRVDFVFIDGHHEEHATLSYLERIFPFLSRSGVVVLDDINWSPGMRRAWTAIQQDPRFGLVLDLFQAGLCAPGHTGTRQVRFRIAYR